MHIKPTRFLEIGFYNAGYNLNRKLHERYTDTDWGDENEIEKAIATDNNKNDNKEDS